jgi:MFS transporter, ACS family, hexuronate transporter
MRPLGGAPPPPPPKTWAASPPGRATARAATPGFGVTLWPGYPWLVLGASLLVQTAASFGNQGLSPLAPLLVADLGLSLSQVGLVITATYLGACLTLTAAGRLSDHFGVRRLFLLGPVGAGLGLALAAGSPSLLWLLLLMAAYGFGNGFALPPTTRSIADWFPGRHRGLAMGVKQTGVALAGVICGLAVPPLAITLGWRGALLALALATIAAGVVAWLVYRDKPATRADAGAARTRSAGSLLRDRNLLLFGGVTWLYAGAQLSLVGFLVLFLRDRLGLAAAEAGLLLALVQAGGVVGRIGWGVVSDLFFGGRRKGLLMLIGLIGGASALALAQVRPGLPAPLLWGLLFVAGLSAVGWNGISMTFVAELGGARGAATAAGMNLTASYLGIMTCPPLFGLLVDRTDSYTAAFEAGAAVYALALVILWRVRPPERA